MKNALRSFFVALAGLVCAAENASPFMAANINSLNGAGLSNGFGGLVARDSNQCLATQSVCGTEFCMPRGGSCCDTIKGTYCKVRYYCYAKGCCPKGKVCTSSPTDGCPSGKQACGNVCITGSSVCCNSKARAVGSWCAYPKTCGVDGKCVSRILMTSAIAVPSSSSSSSLGSIDARETGSPAATSDGSPSKDTGDSSSSKSSNADEKTPIGAIVGGVVGGIAVIALISVGVLLLLRHKKKQKNAVHGQNGQYQPPLTQPPMQQHPPGASPYMANVSPAQGIGYPPSQGSPPPPPPGQSPALAVANQVSSSTGTYSTDIKTGAHSVSPTGFATVSCTPAQTHASQGHNVGEQPILHEMSARSGDDHRGNIHELS
ncbi:hypothetical protein ED733_006650 [Metarhizium rileyi]|uniref:Mid2 domain-containing protein n=1 Tax=Metarhizium rileyi (strain RCEF 4871) TaxID=1649241 RepID=A0A5C6GCC6_METRR|nr:hypothetical protein ED733_006650 [Metarhizium rileyi]